MQSKTLVIQKQAVKDKKTKVWQVAACWFKQKKLQRNLWQKRAVKAKKISLGFLAATFLGWAGLGQATELVVTSEIPVTTNPSPSIEVFLEQLNERTGGAIEGSYYPASQLYNDRDALAAIGTGAVHMVWPVSSRLEQIDERLGVISLPFMLGPVQMTNQCFVDEFTQQMSEYIEPKGMKILGFARTAELMFVMRDKNILQAADLADQKIRVIGGRVMLDAMEQVGASPVSMAASEMSAAVAQGAIDGALTSPAGWHDVIGSSAKHTTLVPGLSLATSAIVVDKGWYDGLNDELRAAIDDTLADVLKTQWVDTITKDEELIANMTAKGGTFHEMNAAETAKVKEAFDEASNEFRSKHPEVFTAIEQIERSCGLLDHAG